MSEKEIKTINELPLCDQKAREEIRQLSEDIANLPSGGGTVVSSIEPMEDDIPKVYFEGTLPTSKDDGDVKVTIHYISKTEDFKYYATLKVQGGSSVSYPKKNFTLKMYEDEALENKVKYTFKNWGKLNKFVLKAHWIDHSHVRNVGTAKIWSKIVQSRSDYESLPTELKNAPNNGATDGFTVKVFANGVYQGLYEWIVPKDKLFGQDGDNVNHSIMNSEMNNQPTCAFSTTTPTINGNWSEELQDSLSSATSTSFANFIKFVAGSTDEEFVANAENYFDVQSVIDYDIFARVFCIVDNLCRNQIFFKYDTKWFEGVWDLDAVLGLPPTTRGFFAYDTEFQTGYIAYKDHQITNMLYQRVENLFANRFKTRYAKLRSSVLSIENIIDVYERLTDVITTYEGLLKEDYASATGDGKFTTIPYTTENNIQQIRKFISQRILYMDEIIDNMSGESGEEGGESGGEDSGNTTVPCTSISLNRTSYSFTNETQITLTATVTPTNTTETITWTSSNSSIATVLNGVVTPIENGDCVITATCGTQSATCNVNVNIVNMLSNINEWTEGCYIANGNLVTSTVDKYSNLVDVSSFAGETLQCSLHDEVNSRAIFYDDTETYISGNNFNTPLTIPSNAKYMRLCLSKTDLSKLPNLGQDKFNVYKIENNLFETEEILDGSYNSETGVYDSSVTVRDCIKFDVTQGEQYICHGLMSVFMFDNAGNVLEKITDKNIKLTVVTVPNGATSMVAVALDYVRKTNGTSCVSKDFTKVGYTDFPTF